MKYIVTRKENVIIFISDTKEYDENGYLLLFNGALAVPLDQANGVYEIETIPDNVKPEKWCYTKESGFYKNENYVEYLTPEQEIEKLKEQVTELQLALVEMFETMGV